MARALFILMFAVYDDMKAEVALGKTGAVSNSAQALRDLGAM